jgi:hypothetical protein
MTIAAFATGLMQLVVVVFLLMGEVRRYPFVLGYCSLQLITSLVEVVVLRTFGAGSRQYRWVFWTDEIGLNLLLFLILILLTYRAMEGSPLREATGRMLAAMTLIVIALPFVLFKGAFVKMAWFDHTSQLLNFGAAILSLGLRSALLRSRPRDKTLLTVSTAFGIIATGVAICFGLRLLIWAPGAAFQAATELFVLAHLAGATILCWAFRPAPWKKFRYQHAAP